jgi:thiol-disulfide isomerase/thioredoxin
VNSRLIVLIVVGVIAALGATISLERGGTQTGKCPAPSGMMAAFQPAADPAKVSGVEFTDSQGRKRDLSSYGGKGVVLNFWATWCPPCVREMPALDRLRAELEADGIEVLALSSDRGGPSVVEKFYTANGIDNLPVMLDEGLRSARALGVRGLPTTVLINAEGYDVGRLVGPAEWDSQDALTLIRGCFKDD